jgi:hypothetical protein
VTIYDYPRLCGGTFFTLVLQALRQRMRAREHYNGERDGLSDPEVLTGLIKVVNPDYQVPKDGLNKGKTNDYKSCKTSEGTYLPFGDTQEVRAFDFRVRNNFREAIKPMSAFIEDFIDTGTSVGKHVHLVKALVDLIQQDQSIPNDDELYIGENGEKTKKAALGDLTEVFLPSFLLGVWHYAVVNRKDNTVGHNTYNKWCPPAGGGPRIFTAHIGEGLLDSLSVYLVGTYGESDLDEENSETVEAEIVEDILSQKSVQQTVNNPFVFNFTQHGNNNTQIGHVDHYHAGKKED